MRRRFLTISLLLLLVTSISACTQTYKNNTVLIDPKTSTFAGIHPDGLKGNKNTVILMHGMCTHDKTWVADVTKNMGFASKSSVKSLETNTKTDVEVYKTKWQEGKNTIDFYGIVYSHELNKVKKEYLCSDIDKDKTETTFCAGSNSYERTRASLNNSIKEVLMNDCLADAVIYSGEAGVKVRQGVSDALAAIEKDQVKNDSPITLVSQSLGSKILRDTLVCGDDVNEKNIKQTNSNIEYLSATQQVFLVSNQIALLNRGNAGQCKKSRNSVMQESLTRGTEENKDNVFDLFDLISKSKSKSKSKTEQIIERSTINESTVTESTVNESVIGNRLSIVSFTDPNDLLSYEVDPKDYKNHAVTNVVVSNAGAFLGLIANPVKVHTSYFANPDVSKLLRCGRGSKKPNICN